MPVVHAKKRILPDPSYERGLAAHLRRTNEPPELVVLLDRFVDGSSELDGLMRRLIWRALARRFGNGVTIGRHARASPIGIFEIGDGVFIGDGAYIQSRAGGRFRLGRKVWIGPGAHFDARDVVLEDDAGWGPGAAAPAHPGFSAAMSAAAADPLKARVRVRRGATLGLNAVALLGVTIGRGTLVGAGTVVTRNLPRGVIAAGIPARVLRSRRTRKIVTK